MNYADEESRMDDKKLGQDIGEGWKSKGGSVFVVVEKSSKATVHARSLIRRPLNLGDSNTRTGIT
jgi:hypothetical protein